MQGEGGKLKRGTAMVRVVELTLPASKRGTVPGSSPGVQSRRGPKTLLCLMGGRGITKGIWDGLLRTGNKKIFGT